MRRAALLLVAATLALMPRAARADAEDELVAVNNRLLSTLKGLPQSMGQTATSDEDAIKNLEATLKWAKPKLLELKDDERIQGVADNQKLLEEELASFRTGHKAWALLHEIGTKHEAAQTAPDEKFKAAAAAAADFQKAANARWKPVAEAFVKLVPTLVKQNQDIGKRNADAEREKTRQLTEARRAALAEHGRKALDHLYLVVKAGEKIPEADLADLKKTGDDLDALVPQSGIFHHHEHARLTRIALWEKPDPEAQQAIADSLGATLLAKGASANRTVQVPFAAAEDSCYLLVGRFARNTGADKLVSLAFSAKEGRGALQTFQLTEAERGESFERGFCAAKATSVTATVTVEFAIPKNGVRWAVVGFERTKFPADLALRLLLDPVDHCDLGHWKSLWTRPVPGTLVWRGNVPFLLRDEEGHAYDLNGAPVDLRVEELWPRPPKAGAVATSFKFPGCSRHGETVWTPESKAAKQCTDPIDRKFARPRTDAAKLRAQPGSGAEEKIAQVEKDYYAEVQKKCGALEAKPAKGAEELFGQLAEALGANPPADPFDRVGGLLARLGSSRVAPATAPPTPRASP